MLYFLWAPESNLHVSKEPLLLEWGTILHCCQWYRRWRTVGRGHCGEHLWVWFYLKQQEKQSVWVTISLFYNAGTHTHTHACMHTHTHTHTHTRTVLCSSQRCRRVNWVPASIDNSDTPLGFRLEALPGDDSADPDPCVRVFYDNPTSNNYVQVLVSETQICQEKL